MSPMVQDYDLYADETFLRGPVAFAFGAVICTPLRAEVLRAALSRLRATAGMTSEIKWTKTSAHTLPFYRKVLDAFFDDRWPRLSVLAVTKGPNWHEWAPNEEERFFKSYYVFLMRNAGPFSRYSVYLDHKSLQRPYRWNTLHFLMNRARRGEWGLRRRNIRVLAAVDSRTADMIQLTDLLLGCATSTSTAEAKSALRQHFALRSREAGKRVRLEEWAPRPPQQSAARNTVMDVGGENG